jgi:hypothetical protein
LHALNASFELPRWTAPAPPAFPLKVIHKTPTEGGAGLSAVVVTFNQPMIRLGRVKRKTEDPGRFPIQIEPPVEAHYRWVAGDTLKVALKAPLRNAHRYRVKVLKTARALSGAQMKKPVSWTFETPRPELLSVSLIPQRRQRADRIRLDDAFVLRFNLKMHPKAVKRRLRLEVGGRAVAFEATRHENDAKRVRIRAKKRFPRSAEITLKLQKGLRSTEGPLPMRKTHTHRFETYGRLTAEILCGDEVLKPNGECVPMHNPYHVGLRLSFSEPVRLSVLKKAFSIRPRVAAIKKHFVPHRHHCSATHAEEQCARRWSVETNLPAEKKIRVRIAQGMRDVFGQRLGRAKTVSFKTHSLPPGLFFPRAGEGQRERWHPYRFSTVNTKSVRVRYKAHRGQDLVQLVRCLRQHKDKWPQQCVRLQQARVRKMSTRAKKNHVKNHRLQLPDGLVALRFESPQVVDYRGRPISFHRLAMMTNLGLHARLTPYGLVVWVTSLKTGRAQKNVTVTVYDGKATRLAQAASDADGLVEISAARLKQTADDKPPQLYLVAKKGQDHTYLSLAGHAKLARFWGRWKDRPYIHCHRYGCVSPSVYAFDFWLSADADRLQREQLGDRHVWQGDRPVLAGYISTERGIYRPGQTVHAHGALRVFQGIRGRPAVGKTVTVRLLSSDNVVLAKKQQVLEKTGVFLTRFTLPAKGRLGYHKVDFRVEGRKESVASRWLRVAEYRPPRFRIRLQLDKKNVYAGDGVTARISGRYLFGGTMRDSAYRVSVTRSPSYWSADFDRAFKVGDQWVFSHLRKVWTRFSGNLDRRGRAVHKVDFSTPRAAEFTFPSYQLVESEVVSAAGRTVAARRVFNHYPGNRMVAFKKLESRKGKIRRHIVLVGPKGKKKGPARVRVMLLSVDESGRPVLENPLHTVTVQAGKQSRLVTVPWPRKQKAHRLPLVYSVTDRKGRTVRSAEWVHRPSRYNRWLERRRKKRRRRKRQLEITTDKKRYLPGETARVTVVRRGLGGQGMLFVERERVFAKRALEFDRNGRAQVTVPVKESFSTAVTLRAVVVRKHKGLRSKRGPVATAEKELRVKSDPFHLKVALQTDKKTYRPRQRVQVKIQVTDGLKRRRQAQVVLMAVDESVLQLTNYHLPDPFDDLHHTPQSSVLADDSRRFLAPLETLVVHRDHVVLSRPGIGYGGWGIGMGGGGGAGGAFGYGGLGLSGKSKQKRARRHFLTTAWHATVVTDANGHAETTFQLPDNLTEYRIMAFAVGRNRSAGTGKTALKVALPLLTLPALPRFARTGDRFFGGVVVYNASRPTGRATVSARIAGQNLSFCGPDRHTVRLKKGKETRVRFCFRAQAAGKAKVRFGVQMGKTNDRVEQTFAVTRPTHMEAVSVSGETRTAVRQAIAPLLGLRADRGGLKVSLASSALVGVEDGLEQLVDYPYGCLEQQSSRLLAVVAAAVMKNRFRLKLKKDPVQIARRSVQAIWAMQRKDGGFGYWPASRRAHPWPTAYALIVLDRVRRATGALGITIPRKALGEAVQYMAHIVPKTQVLGPYWWSYKTLLYYALSLYSAQLEKKHRKSTQEMAKAVLELFEKRHRRPLFARAMLLSTLVQLRRREAKLSAKQKRMLDKAKKKLTAEVVDALRVDGTWAHAEENLHDGYKVLMHSDDRSTAMVLLALLQAAPKHPMITRLVRWFLLGRKQARFRNTQEAAWALMALCDYARIREREIPDFEAGVWLGQKRIVKAFFKGRSVTPQDHAISMERLMEMTGKTARGLVFAKRGKGKLYYTARLRYAPVKLPRKARDHGMTVTRKMQILDQRGRPLQNDREPRFGDTVVVTLSVKANEARRYVVVSDPLPAGLEPLDATLATGSRTFGAWQAWTKVSFWDHRELRDDRVLFFRDHMQPGTLIYRYLARVTSSGRFVVPPTKAEEMYTPEVFGHTAARTVRYGK